MKRTYSQEERNLVFDLWKQGSGFSDIARVLDAKAVSVFTILRDFGGIKPKKGKRSPHHLTIDEREEIRAGLSAKKSIRSIARQFNRSPSTISREVNRNRGRRWDKALNADRRAWVGPAGARRSAPHQRGQRIRWRWNTWGSDELSGAWCLGKQIHNYLCPICPTCMRRASYLTTVLSVSMTLPISTRQSLTVSPAVSSNRCCASAAERRCYLAWS